MASTELVNPGDLYGDPPQPDEDEPFEVLVRRALAKEAAGERLTKREVWAIERSQYASMIHTGPRPRTLARLKRVAELQLGEGLNLVQIADRLGINYGRLRSTLSRYNAYYAKEIERVKTEIIKTGATARLATAAKMVELAQAAARKAPKVWDEAVEATKVEWARDESGEFVPVAEAPDWKTRLEAAKQLRDAFGLNRESEAFSQTKATPLDDATKNLIADTLNLLRGRDLAYQRPIATDAEVISTDERPQD